MIWGLIIGLIMKGGALGRNVAFHYIEYSGKYGADNNFTARHIIPITSCE